MKKLILVIFFFHQPECFRTQTNQNDLKQLATMAENSLMVPTKNRRDQELFLKTKFNALDKITPAPLAVALLGQIVLVAAQTKTDFALECPINGCKHMKYPGSFKASLLQMSFSAYDAFNRAHVNMDEISILTRMIPNEVKHAVMTLIQGEDLDIEHLLPDQLDNIKHIAQSARLRANETVEYFQTVKFILTEIIAGGTTTRHLSTVQVNKLKVQIKKQKDLESHLKEQKQEFEKNKKELKKEIQEVKQKFEEALNNLPSGWDIIAMDTAEALSKTMVEFVNGLATILTVGLNKKISSSGDEANNTQMNTTTNEQNINSIITIPKCNKNTGANIKKDEKKDNTTLTLDVAKRIAIEFTTTINDLILVKASFEQFYENLFDTSNTSGTASFKDNAKEQVQWMTSIITDPKKRIDSKKIPSSLSRDFVLFYENIVSLFDKINLELKQNSSGKVITSLQKETKDLFDTSRCFDTWAKQTMQIPTMNPPTPFSNEKIVQSNNKRPSQVAVENAQIKVESYENQLQNTQQQYEKKAAQLLETNAKLIKAINILHEFEASEATLEEILSILQKALVTLNELQANWLEILEFFQQIETIVDVSLGNALESFRKRIEKGRKIKQINGGVSKLLKNQIYDYIQDTMTNGHLVYRMSEVYINISTQYIMPPVRQLGVMLETEGDKKISALKNKITNQAKEANLAIIAKIEEEKQAFDASVKKRMQEIESTFSPILVHIEPDRKREIKALTATASKSIIQDQDAPKTTYLDFV